MATDEDDISLPSINPSRVRQRQAGEIAEFRKKSERLLSSIPKKYRVERARAIEELSLEEKKLHARLATELEELGIPPIDDVGGASTSSIFTEGTHESKNQEPRGESKAARRRRRKAEKDADEQRRIAEEKASMGPTPKQLEMKAIESQLTPKNLRIHAVSADGHCLYSAIAHQMETKGFASNIPASVEGLRHATANHLMQHKEEYAPFIDEVGGDEEKLIQYCEQLRNEAVWGGQVEVKAMAELLGAAIEIYAADMPVVTMSSTSGDNTVFRVSFHKKYYGLGEHYNSVVTQSNT